MKVESIILQHFWLAFSDKWYWKSIFGLYESGHFKQVLLYCCMFFCQLLFWFSKLNFQNKLFKACRQNVKQFQDQADISEVTNIQVRFSLLEIKYMTLFYDLYS